MKLKIDEMIKERGFLKKHVAKQMGINPNTLSKYITGKRKITLETAIQLADTLNCEVSDLYERKD